MSLIDDIRKDREAGTPGPWRLMPGFGSIRGRVERERPNGNILSLDNHLVALLRPSPERAADATRIARVPDMEAALLAAEALADAVDEWKAKGRTPAVSEALNAALGGFRKATEDRQ